MRSLPSLIRSVAITVITSSLAFFVQRNSQQADKLIADPITFRDFTGNPSFAVIVKNKYFYENLTQSFLREASDLIFEETRKRPTIYNFSSLSQFNEWMYNPRPPKHENRGLWFGVQIDEQNGYSITVIYNASSSKSNKELIQIRRIMTRVITNNKAPILVSISELTSHISSEILSSYIPLFVTLGLINICTLFLTQVVKDVSSERRPYLLLCGVSKITYWISIFITDYLIWTLTTSLTWSIYYCFGIKTFVKFPHNSFLVLEAVGIPMILLFYCFSFFFQDPSSASYYSQMVSLAPVFLFSTPDLTGNEKFNKLLLKIGQYYPLSYLFYSLSDLSKIDLSAIPMMVLAFICFLIFIEYTFTLGEKTVTAVNFQLVKDRFLAHREMFRDFGATEMEEESKHASRSECSLIIRDACRHFKSPSGRNIAAVNHVNLAIKKGEAFGLLGANGAGKTTLMKAIFGRIPLSEGEIYIQDSKISFCPQFDDHLNPLLTVEENLEFFARLFGVPWAEIREQIPVLLDKLDMSEHRNKLTSELSGGTARKLCVLVSLIANFPVVMLDEPTSSLDPLARHKVHELIQSIKGTRTIVLCTHLLGEAETLCDKIGIMIHGCMYAYGTPQALSNHYGKDWKVDILVNNSNQNAVEEIRQFVTRRFEEAKLLFIREKTLVYAIPTKDAKLSEVIDYMEEGLDGDYGISYYTCSSSNLEKVFMEIVRVTENPEVSNTEEDI